MTLAVTNEGIRVTPATYCRLCGKQGRTFARGCRDRIFAAPGEWSIRECHSCGLAWLDPQPKPEDVARLYDCYHTHEARTASPDSRSNWKDRLHLGILARTLGYGTHRSTWIARAAIATSPLADWAQGQVMWLKRREGRLLDVGCGSGAFLARMRGLGWHVEGVEPDPKAARVASDTLGLTVHQGDLEQLDLAASSYHAVTLSHVIEHVPDPVTTLRECGRLLADDGLLVVTTPNRESLAARRFGPHWRGWEAPRHLHVFTTRSLHACALRAGLHVTTLRTTARIACFMWRASQDLARYGRLPGGDTNRKPWAKKLPGLFTWVLEHYTSRFRPVGEEVLMIARRHSAPGDERNQRGGN